MNKKIVFVSVPMRNKTDDMIERAILIAQKNYLRMTKQHPEDIEFINNHMRYERIQVPDNANANVIYLSEAIKKIGNSNEVIFGKDWKYANGCIIEHEVCVRYGIKYYEV